MLNIIFKRSIFLVWILVVSVGVSKSKPRKNKAPSSASITQFEAKLFPQGPRDDMTPGALCDKPDSYRYPEKIPYCERAVSSSEKWDIIDSYDAIKKSDDSGDTLYEIGKFRHEFKIDHLIPLCAGGSNTEDNLWPQHLTISNKTDKIEQRICQLMSAGLLKQADAVKIILEVKHHLETTEKVFESLGKTKE